jgi:hypothetical protein
MFCLLLVHELGHQLTVSLGQVAVPLSEVEILLSSLFAFEQFTESVFLIHWHFSFPMSLLSQGKYAILTPRDASSLGALLSPGIAPVPARRQRFQWPVNHVFLGVVSSSP